MPKTIKNMHKDVLTEKESNKKVFAVMLLRKLTVHEVPS